MILTLRSLADTVHIDITADQFKRLRDPQITNDEISDIAALCGCDAALLKEYVDDLKRAMKETIELDGSCDYSDHL
ncbi:MAG: hypothetical protein PHQ90_06360 [Sulfuricurvum sp.]|uniref:hypothetical protein n=1 Tax=Sulfuricurvum sp. TaxID=2025608 RepID=UPI00262726CC|nr:hypothetical protein [Sulfuricurvum sp.]MDD2368908.1 hypothetical protein [Sulfuricurvum sp.]MDD2950967.1 hypothetical protein [Sulfuricurvum sp.]MDD5117562.1 hypothetical protein [Sulfuricurvum sp.]